MTKILAVFGTRPEAIKLAPVIRELKERSSDPINAARGGSQVEVRVCVTGQHRQMLDQMLRLFRISPDYDLHVMTEVQSPTKVASTVLAQLEPVLESERPDWVLVQGDTTTVAAASLAAFYASAKVGHVEAGLRTWDKWQPFPEEINRRVASVIADMHFAPTEWARNNLLREGVAQDHILVTGNPVIDALHWVANLDDKDQLSTVAPLIDAASNKKMILVTAHRRENFGAPLENICLALKDIVERYGDKVQIVYPVHLNPRVWDPVHRLLADVPGIALVAPLEYLALVRLMRCSWLVLTDSGGIQEEAPGLGKPVLVLRELTERPEAVQAGTVRLVGTDRLRILAETVRLWEQPDSYAEMARAVNPYGDGRAAFRIASALLGQEPAPFDPGKQL